MPTIIFTCKDGQVTSDASGFVGSACEAVTKEFTKALGGKVVKSVKKPEYYQAAPQGSSVKAGGRSS